MYKPKTIFGIRVQNKNNQLTSASNVGHIKLAYCGVCPMPGPALVGSIQLTFMTIENSSGLIWPSSPIISILEIPPFLTHHPYTNIFVIGSIIYQPGTYGTTGALGSLLIVTQTTTPHNSRPDQTSSFCFLNGPKSIYII